jgi:hypothetical protein
MCGDDGKVGRGEKRGREGNGREERKATNESVSNGAFVAEGEDQLEEGGGVVRERRWRRKLEERGDIDLILMKRWKGKSRSGKGEQPEQLSGRESAAACGSEQGVRKAKR